MLVFVFFIAVLNLAVGYALGKGIGLSFVLSMIPSRTPKAAPVDLEDEEPLTRPAPAVEEKKEEPAKTETAAEATTDQEQPAGPTKADVLASLAQVRTQMSDASVELKQNQADPEKFEQSASKLQEANHAYLEEADGAIKQLKEIDGSGEEGASATQEAVAEGTTRVAEMSKELDGLIESGLDSEQARAELVAKAGEIGRAAEEIEAKSAAEAPAAVPDTPKEREPAEPIAELSNSMQSIDEIFDRLETLLEASEPDAVQYLAALRVDPVADHEDDQPLMESLEGAVARLAADELGGIQSHASGHPTMILLDGNTFEEAAEQLERLRQQVDAATFDQGGTAIKATITCAVTDATSELGRDQLVEQLNQALEESARLGTNRTFHHDGVFPTPVPEQPLEVESRTLAIA